MTIDWDKYGLSLHKDDDSADSVSIEEYISSELNRIGNKTITKNEASQIDTDLSSHYMRLRQPKKKAPEPLEKGSLPEARYTTLARQDTMERALQALKRTIKHSWGTEQAEARRHFAVIRKLCEGAFKCSPYI